LVIATVKEMLHVVDGLIPADFLDTDVNERLVVVEDTRMRTEEVADEGGAASPRGHDLSVGQTMF
jgi:hypothetical protein